MLPLYWLASLALPIVIAVAEANHDGQDVYIVEFMDRIPSTDPILALEQGLAGRGLSCNLAPRHMFTTSLFSGASFTTDCVHDVSTSEASVLSALRALDIVQNAWPAAWDTTKARHQRPAGSLTKGSSQQPLRTLKRQSSDNGTIPVVYHDHDVLTTHNDTGVDKLHAEGIVGSGVRIAVIDTGFDLKAPGLAKTRIAYNYNSAEDAFDFEGDNCLDFLHGTHVLGIIAADSDERRFGIVGVAPNATVDLHGLDSCDGTRPGNLDDLMAAVVSAAERGVDVMMIGFNIKLAFQEEPVASLVSRVVRNGTAVTVASSNDGPGLFTGASPASGEGVAAIGSTDNSATPYYTWGANWTSGSDQGVLRFAPSFPSNFATNNNLTLWMPADPESFPDGCNPAPSNFVPPADPANTVMLIDEDHCWLDPKNASARLAISLGVPYVVRYQSASTTVADGMQWVPNFAEFSRRYQGIARISNEDGQFLKSQLAKGSVHLSFPSDVLQAQEDVTYRINDISGGLVSSFSSWGPTPEGRSYPSFVAPGENILSTFLPKYGGLAVIGGTSMSNPFAVGVFALVKEKHPDYDPKQILSVVTTTAKPVKFIDGNRKSFDYLAPVFSQGGGLVDAWGAAHAVSLVNVSSLDFNDTLHRPSSLAFTLNNTGTETLSCSLSHLGAASGYILDQANPYSLTEAEGHPVYAEVDITPSSIEIPPRSEAVVSVSIKASPALPDAAKRGTFFGGYIHIQSSAAAGTNLTIPYTGFGTPLVNLPMINPNASYLVSVDPATNVDNRVESGTTFECFYNGSIPKPDWPASCTPGFPGFRKTFVTQSRNYSYDLVDAATGDAILPRTFVGTAERYTEPSAWWVWDGSEEDRKYIPPGRYFWRVRALRLSGGAGDQKHWDHRAADGFALRAPISTHNLSLVFIFGCGCEKIFKVFQRLY
ncbi:Minor extracellular protease vpr [Colletotrichum fructicola Nara gc5]|uniref:Minor extracellular protease vpr n=1 Tax=Colletotrichum fructicola (strain Nara gc5) TaxID=1213859 RepID=A0A7J6IN32_COLFN|nr:Minor extracellular protease vpr [Colletotrichum fructicola Nara gc5]